MNTQNNENRQQQFLYVIGLGQSMEQKKHDLHKVHPMFSKNSERINYFTSSSYLLDKTLIVMLGQSYIL
jgi:hypothetical protein